MSLLMKLMENPLDADYAEAAERRQAGAPPPGRASRAILLVVLVCVGMFTTVAVAQAREEPITNEQRERLIGEIKEGTARTDRLEEQLVSLRQQVTDIRAARLAKSRRGQQARTRLRRLEIAAAVVPVAGPGLVVTLDDRPPGESGIATSVGSGKVLDRDIQLLVDALWTAGADAVAVDGQRITSLTAIRSAGEAILVNYRPINPPYTVTAIGNPDILRSRLADSDVGRRFHTLQANLGIRFEVAKRSEVRLPGGSGVSLRYAREVDRK